MYDLELTANKKELTTAEIKKLIEDIKFFCNTPKGTLPQNREFGLDQTILDESFPILRMKATVDIVTGVRKFFNINLTEINITANADGGIKVKICI